MSRGFDGFESDGFRDSGFDSGRDVGRSSSSDWNARTRLHNVHREEDRADQLDGEERQRSRAERPPLAREERVEGILSQRTRGAASRSRGRRETRIWTQVQSPAQPASARVN